MSKKTPKSNAEKAQKPPSVAAAIRARGAWASKLFVWESPKTGKRWIIEGEVAFFQTVLMEGDLEVLGFDLDPDPVYTSINGETVQTKLDAVINHAVLGQVWTEFKRDVDAGPRRTGRAGLQLSAQAQAARAAGKRYQVKTESDCRGREFLYSNWLFLCACITRARRFSKGRETTWLMDALHRHGTLQVDTVLREKELDPALMLATVATGLQSGALEADLDARLFDRTSYIRLSKS